MRKLRALLLRLAGMFHQARRERELDAELESHLQMHIGDNLRSSMTPEEARRQALFKLGGLEQTKEIYRDRRGLPLFENLFQDLRYGLRTLRRTPGFTAVAVITLGLGIGANSAMFSVVNGVLLRSLPYAHPDRLVRVTGYYPKGAIASLRSDSRTMEVAAYTADYALSLTGRGEAERLTGRGVSANFFSLLGAPAELGRTFRPEEDRPGQDRLVIVSDSLWKNKFDGDPEILGHLIRIDGEDRQVIGVMPPTFEFPSPGTQVWIPLDFDPRNSFDYWNTNFLPLIARLQPGATLAQARNELRPLISHIITLFPYVMARNWNANASVIPLQQDLVSGIRGRLTALQCAVALVLLIACANVAGLLLSRAAVRGKEIAVRAALGAARRRILGQLLTESVVLALAGGGVGFLLASAALPILKLALPSNAPGAAAIAIDEQVLAFTSLLAIVTGLAFGLAPALTSSKVDLAESLKTGGRRSADTASFRVRGALIAGEVALAVVLTVSAGLLIKSLWRLAGANPGFDPQQVVTVPVSPAPALCKQRASCVSLYSELLQQVQDLTGVSEVAAANTVPLDGQFPSIPAELEGHPLEATTEPAPMLWGGAVTPDYFRLMHIPLLEGRSFRDTDTENSEPVVVVSAATVRKFWPNQYPIGKHLRPVWDGEPWRTVVGVAGDVRQYSLANSLPSGIAGAMYMPYPQAEDIRQQLPTAMTLILRTDLPPGQIGRPLQAILARVNPNVPIGEIRTMEEITTASTSQSRSMMWLFVSFAGVALLLAAVGTYGVISHSTSQRTFEIAMRMALGASRRDILAMVLRQSLRLVLSGLVLGMAAALAVTRLLSAFLYNTAATDAATFIGVAGLLVITGLLAGFVPARRAANVDALTALRME
jgi:putative ABC transport system permease protein